jgi:hypothetical protein
VKCCACSLLLPFIYTGPSMFHYPLHSVAFVVAGGLLNALGSWALLAAMKSGGVTLALAAIVLLAG